MKENIPEELEKAITPSHFFYEIIRTQAMVKLLLRNNYAVADPQMKEDINNAFLKGLQDFVKANESIFKNPDDLITELIKQMTE